MDDTKHNTGVRQTPKRRGIRIQASLRQWTTPNTILGLGKLPKRRGIPIQASLRQWTTPNTILGLGKLPKRRGIPIRAYLRQWTTSNTILGLGKLPKCRRIRIQASLKIWTTPNTISIQKIYPRQLHKLANKALDRDIRNGCRGLTTCHHVLQMQPYVISFYGVTSRITFIFLLFPQVSRN